MGELALIEAKRWTITEIGLALANPDLPYEDFDHLCFILGRVHQAVRFAIGDAILQGEALYGERAYQAFERFQLSEEAMKEYVRVAQRVPRARRVVGLSWSHHRAVAPLEAVQQREWLSRALDESMSHADLRTELRGIPSRNGEQPEVCVSCGRPL